MQGKILTIFPFFYKYFAMRSILILLLSSSFILASGQDTTLFSFKKAETDLAELFDMLYENSDSVDYNTLTGDIISKFKTALSVEGSFDYPWSGLTRIGKITSGDQQIRIFTWHVALDRNHYKYYGFLQVSLKKNKVALYEFIDNDVENQHREILDQSMDDWYGKLYYNIVVTHNKRDTYYTLLGKDFNNALSTLKTIETIELKRNKPVFTKGMYFEGRDRKDRIVLEYSARVSISVRYNAELNQIVFDHLVPLDPVYTGNYEFYGPDGSYDGLEFSDGIWILREDVDARNTY